MRSARVLAWGAAATASIVLGLWILLQWMILPRLQTWQPELEQGLSEVLGVPARLSSVSVQGNLWAPVVEIHGLKVQDPQGQAGLELERVRVTITPGSLLPRSGSGWQPHLDRIELQSPDLTVRRLADGRFSVGGIPVSSQSQTDEPSPAADWLLTQGAWVIHGGRLRWIDEQGSAEPLDLQDVNLELTHHAGRHRLALEATPPAILGKRLNVEADMKSPLWARLQHPGDWMRWRGSVQLRWPEVEWNALRRWWPTAPATVQDARFHLDTTTEVDRGQWTGLDARLSVPHLRIQGAEPGTSLIVAQLQGVLRARRTPGQSWRLDATGWRFELPGEGSHTPQVWQPSDWQIELTGPDGEWTAGHLKASRLDLALATRIAVPLLPSGPARDQLQQAAPAGSLAEVQWKWTGPWRQPQRWSAEGSGQNLAVRGRESARSTAAHPLPGRPGLQGADIRFKADEQGGSATVAIRQGLLEFPGVFEEPRVPMEQLDADLNWSGQGADWTVQVKRARFANADAAGSLSGQWQTGDGKRQPRLPGTLTLDTRLERAEANRVHRYLPLQIPPATRHYVRDGIQAGHARAVKARVQGPLEHFPWADGRSGTFRIEAQVEDVRYDVAPQPPGSRDHWPPLTGVSGLLTFEGQSMRVKDARAGLAQTGSGTFQLSPVNARIDDFVHQPVLHIEGRGRGPLQDGLRYVAESPVGRWIHDVLAPASASGSATLDLKLALPLADMERSTVKGLVTLDHNTLRLRPDVPRLDGAQGRIEFDERGFKLHDTRARGLGGSVTLSGGTQPDGHIRVLGQGLATAAGLREAPELGFVAPLARFLSGESEYRLDLGFDPRGMSLQVDSPLTGLALQAPAPFSKPSASSLPLQVRIQPAPDAPPGRPLETVRVDLGPLLRAQYVRDLTPEAKVQRGLLQVGTAALQSPAAWPSQGVRLQIDLPVTQAESWLSWQDQAESVGLLDPGPTRVESGYAPNEILMRTARLQVGPREFSQVVATLRRDSRQEGQVWNGPVQASQLAGSVAMLLPFDSRLPSQLRARLSRLELPDDPGPSARTAPGVSGSSGLGATLPSTGAAAEAPRRLPDIDLEADRFRLGDKDLGKLVLQAGHQIELGNTQAAGAWLLKRLSLKQEGAELQAVGRWLPPGRGQAGPNATRMTFRLDVSDAGALLSHLGQPGALRGGKGALIGQLDWQGSPTQFNIASLAGQMTLDLQRGQFLQAEPGVARLLGILSLQSLPRRLLLDFRDVFQKGFTFDHIDGQVTVQRGVATTRNLRMRGVQALVLTEGQADLAGETQNLRIWVVPDLDAGAASLAYAVINPAIGLGTFIGQMFLSKPLTEAATREFLVTGTWDEPKVAPVAHRTPVPHPEIASSGADPRGAAAAQIAASPETAPAARQQDKPTAATITP